MAEQKKSSAKAMILPPLVLAVICAVCCAFLALANMVTKDKIAAAEADAIQSSLQQLPDAGTFEEITDFTPENNEKATATGLYQDEKGQFAVLVTADGYNKGGLQVVIGVDNITGATYSSKGLKAAVNCALATVSANQEVTGA